MPGPGTDAELTKDVEWIAERLASLGLIHPGVERLDTEILALQANLRRLAANNAALRQRLSMRLAEERDSTVD